MSPTTVKLAAAINSRLHLPHRKRCRQPVRVCSPGTYTRAAVYRHGEVAKCPECAAAPVAVEPFMDGRIRVVPHRRLSSVTVVTVRGVDR